MTKEELTQFLDQFGSESQTNVVDVTEQLLDIVRFTPLRTANTKNGPRGVREMCWTARSGKNLELTVWSEPGESPVIGDSVIIKPRLDKDGKIMEVDGKVQYSASLAKAVEAA